MNGKNRIPAKSASLGQVAKLPEREPDRYYLFVSDVFKGFKYLCYTVLVLFLIFMISMWRDRLTYDNFKYMLKDLDTSSADTGSSEYLPIDYDTLTNPDFAFFRGDIAVAGSNRLSLYNSSGNRLYTDTRSISKPVIRTGDKYMLAYDIGGYSYTLYNSFSQLYEGTTSYAITCADIADDGSFLLVTGARDAKYVVSMYNNSFKQIANYYKDKYVTGAYLRRDGSALAIISADSDGGTVAGEVMICDRDAETARAVYTLKGVLPLYAHWFDDGALAVVCDKGIWFFSADGDMTGSYTAVENGITRAAYCGSMMAVVYSDNIVGSDNTVLVFDSAGDMIYNYTVSERIEAIAITDAVQIADVFTLSSDDAAATRIKRTDSGEVTAETETALLTGSEKEIIVTDSGAALVCSPSKIKTIFQPSGG